MSLVRKTNQRTLLDLYSSLEDFKTDLEGSYSALKPDVTDNTIATTYYLIIGRYGDSPILGYLDEGRWKLRLFTVYLSETPDWEVKTDIQKSIRALTTAEIAKGSVSIFNTALNPNTEPTDTSNEELSYINQQNTSRRTLNELDALLSKYNSLDSTINDRYLDKFAKLFSKFTTRDTPLHLYIDNEVDPYDE